MNSSSHRPFAALAGVGFCVLVIAGTLAAGPDPGFAAPPEEVATYFVDSEAAVLASATLYMLAGACLIVFAAFLRELVAPRSDRLAATVHGGAVAGGALWIASAAVIASGALRAGDQGVIDPATAAASWDIGNVLYGSAAPVALAVAALGLALSRALPAWHVVLTAVLGVALLIPVVNFVAVIVFGFWCLLTGGMLFLAPRPDAVGPAASPAGA